jgi:formylglycine-generating enzyme required for sulfatase activity
MHGDVWEWCWDWYANYKQVLNNDPTGPSSGTDRVLRSGSYFDFPALLRSANRTGILPALRNWNYGLRLARTYH